MNKPLSQFRKLCGALAAAAVLSTTLFVAVPSAQADPHDKCRHRIEKAEARLDEAIRHHGERSPQAEARRRDLNAERERCWEKYHGWWDGRDHQWHNDRDWDHDHDHDHP
ncbi:MAG TPA: hypothetical protein VLV49_10180 [Terriglobales bacterium]|nr:hypothetical protein [Terriglobales bacterium]